jgi:cholinesterase
MLHQTVLILATCLACAAQASPIGLHRGNWTIGQTVSTSSGPVEGHAADNDQGVSEYLGIPYAQPPVGELRFQPPVTFNGTKTINGTNFGFICMQVDMFADIPHTQQAYLGKREGKITPDALAIIKGYFAGIPATNEDCLTLNVWTKPQVGEEKKAVLVCSNCTLWT